jgi:hypothetical protein
MKCIQLIVLILLTAVSCREERQLPRLHVKNHEVEKRIDSKMMLRSHSPILAINFVNDTTMISKISDMENYHDKDNDTTSLTDRYDNLKVIVDTSYTFSNPGFIFRPVAEITKREKLLLQSQSYSDRMKLAENYYERYLRRTDSLKMYYVSSYPVLIYNASNSDLHFGLEPIHIIQEALDVDNKWKPIEFTYQMPGCGTGASIIRFKVRPKHYLATAAIKYKGDFKTKIRLNYLDAEDQYIQTNLSDILTAHNSTKKLLEIF